MKNNELLNQWLLVNTELHNSLEELKTLDAEREKIKATFEETKTITPKLNEQMQNSIKKYENLLEKIKELKLKSKNLKTELDKKKSKK